VSRAQEQVPTYRYALSVDNSQGFGWCGIGNRLFTFDTRQSQGYTAAMYCFRNRFSLPDRRRISVDAAEWELTSGNSLSVSIKSTTEGEAIKEATELVLRGKGYRSHDDALAEGYRWRDTLQAALALLNIGADFGDRLPTGGGLTPDVLEQAAQAASRPVINEKPGLQVFECDPPPLLIRMSATGVAMANEERTRSVLLAAAQSEIHFSEVERLAYDLFSTSFFQPSPDARLVTLMMALETLLELESRSREAREHVDELIRQTKATDLPLAERQSIIGSLNLLRNESISQAGRRLSERLGGRTYMGMKPRKFFTEAYDMRSKLTHGTVPRPSHTEIGKTAASLEVFVGHLLSSSLLASDA